MAHPISILAAALTLTLAACEYASVECEFDFECNENEACIAGLCVPPDASPDLGADVAEVGPDAQECAPETETCDGVDNDCDGEVDEDASDAQSVYEDRDGDGFGVGSAALICNPGPQWSDNADDCDDTRDDIYPGAPETCSDTVDMNCDGSVAFEDRDDDGWAACEECNDTDPSVHPDARELDADGVDSNCDGRERCYVDADNDGYRTDALEDSDDTTCTEDGLALERAPASDCNDLLADVHPEAAEVCDDVDNDCDGVVDEGVTQACGGCATLSSEPGLGCGECGEWVCDGTEVLTCNEDPDWCTEGFCNVDGDERTCACPIGYHGDRCELSCFDGEQNGAEEATDCGGPCGECLPVRDLDHSREHGCAVLGDGRLRCWGNNEAGQATPPDGRYAKAATGDDFACAIGLEDGRLHCWGSDAHGQLDAPAASGFDEIDCGRSHCCARDGASVSCWGDNLVGQSTVPHDDGYTSLALGNHTSCALRWGSPQCWGDGGSGQAPAPALFDQSYLDNGGQFVCSLSGTGVPTCWGDAEFDRTAPPSGTFLALALDKYSGCGQRGDGSIECWGIVDGVVPAGVQTLVSPVCGLNSDGMATCWSSFQAGAMLPARVGPATTELQVRDLGGCWLDSGWVECWGPISAILEDRYPSEFGSTVWPPDLENGRLLWLEIGTESACAGNELGARCWGFGRESAPLPPPGDLTQVCSGGLYYCGLSEAGHPLCWGEGDSGELAPPDRPLTTLSCGTQFACGLDMDGDLSCWGDTPSGTDSTTGSYASIAAGADSVCAISRDDATVACWGNASVVDLAPTGQRLHEITVGETFACGLADGGTTVCWGTGRAVDDRPSTEIYGVLRASGRSVCGITDDARISCWGSQVW